MRNAVDDVKPRAIELYVSTLPTAGFLLTILGLWTPAQAILCASS